MPRPGYEAEDDSHLDGDNLILRFDPEIREELAKRMQDGKITDAHVAQLYKLVTNAPEERDADTIAELLDATEGMGGEEFKKWVDDRITRWKDR